MGVGDATVNNINPSARKCCFFDGVDDYVGVSASDSLDENITTISFWFKTTDASSTQKIINKGTGAADKGGWDFDTYSDTLRLIVGNGTDWSVESVSISSNTWYHVAGVVDSDTIYLYINGNLVGTESISGGMDSSEDEPVDIGAKDSDKYFNGTIHSVRIFSRALSASEVTKVMNDDKDFLDTEKDRKNLVGKWDLKDNANDTSGFGNDGTLTGGARLGIFEQNIKTALEAARTGANDRFMLADTSRGTQVISVGVEEA